MLLPVSRSLHRIGEIELFAQKRRGAVAKVLVAGEGLLIVLECCAALLQRDVKPLQLQMHAAAGVAYFSRKRFATGYSFESLTKSVVPVPKPESWE